MTWNILYEDGFRVLKEGGVDAVVREDFLATTQVDGAVLDLVWDLAAETPVTPPVVSPPVEVLPDVRFPGIEHSHQVVVECTLLATGGNTLDLMPGLLDGSVTLDGTAATRGQCDLSLVSVEGLDLVPSAPSSPLAPYGNEIQIRRGIRTPDGVEQLVSLGIFRIQDTEVTTDGEIRVTGFDRSKRVSDGKFLDPYTIASGTDYLTAILNVVRQGWAGVPYDAASFSAVSLQTPLAIAEEGDDPWDLAQTMAAFIGHDLYFNRDGILVIPAIPQISGAPVAYLREGENGLLLSADTTWTREESFNRVTFTGEGTDVDGVPPRDFAQDDNPDSPTRYGGPFGNVPIWESSNWIVTQEQAKTAASGKLAKEMGTSRSIDFGSLVDPLLQPGDIVWITRQASDIDESHIIDTLTIPLGHADQMSGTTRSTLVQQVTA